MNMQPAEPTSTSERAALRKAIAARDAGKERVRVTGEAVECGKQLLRAAETKLIAFGDVDDAILKHRAASFKTAAKGGPRPSLALTEELLRRERARDEAASAVAAARVAHTGLVGEFAEAQDSLRQAESKVSELAGQVLVSETVEQGLDLGGLWNQLWATVDSLNALRSSGVQLPRDVVCSLQSFDAMDYRQHPGGRNAQLARALSYWKEYRQALCAKADATEPEQLIGGDVPPAAERAA